MKKLPRGARSVRLNIDPKYASMIYAGEKTMEFRKKRLPLKSYVELVEDGKQTGYMILCWEFRSTAEAVWAFAQRRGVLFAGKGRTGITKKWLTDYAGKDYVSVYGIVCAKRMIPQAGDKPTAWADKTTEG